MHGGFCHFLYSDLYCLLDRGRYINGFPRGAQVEYHDSGSRGKEGPGGSLNHLQHLWPQWDFQPPHPGRDLHIFIDEITNFLAVVWVIKWKILSLWEINGDKTDLAVGEMRKWRGFVCCKLITVSLAHLYLVMCCAINLYRGKHWIRNASATQPFSGD